MVIKPTMTLSLRPSSWPMAFASFPSGAPICTSSTTGPMSMTSVSIAKASKPSTLNWKAWASTVYEPVPIMASLLKFKRRSWPFGIPKRSQISNYRFLSLSHGPLIGANVKDAGEFLEGGDEFGAEVSALVGEVHDEAPAGQGQT